MKHALSFDIEDWFHIVGIRELEDRSKWDSFSTLVESKTDLILSILDEYEVQATFFILGWVARKYPAIAKKIAEAGHEIGSHSFWHRRVYELTPQEFHADLTESMDVLQTQTGKKIKGFRAPSFSITPGSEWAFEIIKDVGFQYDASLFPTQRGHGGYPCNQEPHNIELKEGILPELPMSVYKRNIFKMPFSGGGYMRLLPYWIIDNGFREFERQGIPVVVYLHPRDFAPECPRIKMPIYRKFKSYTGLHTTEIKLRKLLKSFKFGTCESVIFSSLEEIQNKNLD